MWFCESVASLMNKELQVEPSKAITKKDHVKQSNECLVVLIILNTIQLTM